MSPPRPSKRSVNNREDNQVLEGTSNPPGLLHKGQQEAPRLQYSVAQMGKTDGRREIREFPRSNVNSVTGTNSFPAL